jgi:NADH:ubiquinone oxidoreductase subunit K
MPSTFKHPAHVPMWRGAKVAYFFIAMCLFPVSIGGYWAYGNLVSVLTGTSLSFSSIQKSMMISKYHYQIPSKTMHTVFVLVHFQMLGN